MLRDQAARLLKIHPAEARMVALVAALFLCLQAGQGIGENAAFALFLSRLDINLLPYMYMGQGVFVSLASLVYATSLSRFQDANVVLYLLAAAVVLFTIEWAAITFLQIALYPVLWLTTFGIGVILGTLLWTIAGEVCDARQAKRLFPIFTSMGILGSVLGNLLTGGIARIAGTTDLILLYAILLGAGFLLTRVITRTYFKPGTARARYTLLNDMRAGFDFVRESPLFRILGVSAILYSLLYFTVDFPFSAIVSNHFMGDEASLAGFKGLLTSTTTAVTFLISLFVANRLYTRLGIVNSILIMPITYLVTIILFFGSYTFGGAVIARFAQMVVLGGLMSTAWNTLFNVVPPERRGQVLAFNNGVPAQIGVVLSGLMILLSKRILDTQAILLLGGFVALANIFLALRMKPAYGEALLRALRAGRAEVFSEQEEAFSGYRNDPAALQVLRTELRNPKTHMRRLAAEMLARVGNLSAVPDLVQRLSDPEPEVRAAATRALVELDADSATSEILLGLDDPAEIVREQTLASLPRLKPAPSPELIRLLEHLLDDPNLQIAAYAAGMLLLLHREECARPFLGSLLRDENVTRRHIALDALGRIAGVGDAQTAFNLELVLNALNDPSALIRRDAIKVAALFEVEAAYAAIFKCLSDSDATVRRLASEAMKQAWSWSYESVFQILEERNDPALEAALEAIPPGDPLNFYPLRGYIQREASKIRRMRRLIEALPEEGRALALLLETLKRHELASEERLIKAVGLFRNPRALDLIRKSLNAGDAATRAAALEALETLGEREVTREILPLLDGAGILASAADQKMGLPEAVSVLLGDQDDWLRALMAWSVPELDLKEFVPALHTLSSDPALLVRQAAMDALARMEDGDKMKTLKTISALERILLLREVPMFSGLCPEDLEQIAQVAEEQIYPDQAVICYEGEPGNTLFIISSGRIQVVKTSDQKEHILAVRTAGQFVGEMAILESAPRSATLKANGDVRVLAIDGNAFTSILLDRPEVAVSVLRHMSSRVRELNEKVGAAG